MLKVKVMKGLERIGLISSIDILCKRAAGLSIYASTVIKFVLSNHHPLEERLALIVSLPEDTSHEGKLGADPLYTHVLEQAFCDVDSNDPAYTLILSLWWGLWSLSSTPSLLKHFQISRGTIVLHLEYSTIYTPSTLSFLSQKMQNPLFGSSTSHFLTFSQTQNDAPTTNSS